MATSGTSHIPLYPELRACTAPSAARILELFSDLTRHELRHDDQIVQTFHPNSARYKTKSSNSSRSPPPATPHERRAPDPHKWGPNAQREVRNVRW